MHQMRGSQPLAPPSLAPWKSTLPRSLSTSPHAPPLLLANLDIELRPPPPPPPRPRPPPPPPL